MMRLTREQHLDEYGNWVRGGCEVSITDKKAGQPVQIGDTVVSFRGEAYELTGTSRFRSTELGKTGKVTVRPIGGGSSQEYYDSVFGLRVELTEGALAQ